MSEVDAGIAPAVIAEATAMGWVPKESFRGDPEKWVKADVFVEKGKTMLPLLRKHSKELEDQLRNSNQKIAELSETVAASQEAITALREFHDEDTKRQVKKAKDALLESLVEAKKSGDVDAEVRLTDELVEMNAAIKAADAVDKTQKVKPKVNAQEANLDPDYQEFLDQNPWFGKDIRRTNKATGIVHLLRSDPANDGLFGKAFFDRVTELMEAPEGRPVSKVAGARHSSSSGGGSSGKSYADLPQDAKDACLKQAKKLVGPGRAFKDMASWQENYAATFFREY